MKLLIKNGRVVHPVTGAVLLQDILVEDGRIAVLERGLPAEAGETIDASGLAVAPGLVDMHVHLRDPGLTYKEDILTGCAAAARGGVTSMACMADTSPAVDCPEQVAYRPGPDRPTGWRSIPSPPSPWGCGGRSPPTPRP